MKLWRLSKTIAGILTSLSVTLVPMVAVILQHQDTSRVVALAAPYQANTVFPTIDPTELACLIADIFNQGYHVGCLDTSPNTIHVAEVIARCASSGQNTVYLCYPSQKVLIVKNVSARMSCKTHSASKLVDMP